MAARAKTARKATTTQSRIATKTTTTSKTATKSTKTKSRTQSQIKIQNKAIKLETDDDYEENADIKPLQISNIQQEAAIMSQLRHENIVSCYASFVVRDELWLIMPFVSGGSVSYILSHSLKSHFTKGIKDENILCCILKDTLSGISYMHNQGRIH
eukprot:12839_1